MDRALSARLGRPLPSFGAPHLRGAVSFIWRRRRLRITVLATLGALIFALAALLFLRHSSLAAVQRVRVSGAHGADAAQIDAALTRAARGMSTLDVKRGALLAAVARFPIVRDLRVSPSFPHGLRIRVIEQPPVAVLVAGDRSEASQRTAVAADGVVLGSALVTATLPSVRVGGVDPLPGQRVAGASTRVELSVLGAAPRTLLGWVQRIFTGPEGLTVEMRDGLAIYFGNATRPHAKWLAAARVLADSSSAGASYLDVRLPERPAAGSDAAGGLAAGPSSTQVSASDPSAAALAATLDEAVSGGSQPNAAAAAPSEPVAAASESAAAAGEPAASEAGASEAAASEPGASVSTSAAPATGASSESAIP